MRIPGWILSLALIVGLAMIVKAQSLPATPNPYVPSEVQSLRLKVAQQSAQLAQAQLREAQQAFQSALSNLNSEAEKVRLENKWPEDVTMDYDKLTFAKKAAPPAAKGDKK